METWIQIIILACLLVIILLLLVDKVKIIKIKKPQEELLKPERLPDIMGKPVLVQKERPLYPKKYPKMMADRLKKRDTAVEARPVSTTEAGEDGVSGSMDWSDDEINNESQPEDGHFTQGVSLEELMRVGDLLKQDHLNEVQENQTAEIIQKIRGTELFDAMQSSIQGASQKIARLLDKSLSENQLGDVQVKYKGPEQFDIGDFL
ncbi:hypothetical protein OK18_00610 [Chryseobacterium gallinarum]|uniref:Conjugal transfer protein TraD n=1 Tax=Chryseobacterium gallinarum TaxID=1324352 RepID=A0A0G3LWJ6_CHRGL|nr:hypothetical protein [Chryseobacterium gallinarum]AKK71336.1 hypothetical protein OK18_00610 [Chryseobacterium gallinarum]